MTGDTCPYHAVIFVSTPGGGGGGDRGRGGRGGHSQYILVGVCRSTSKGGGGGLSYKQKIEHVSEYLPRLHFKADTTGGS